MGTAVAASRVLLDYATRALGAQSNGNDGGERPALVNLTLVASPGVQLAPSSDVDLTTEIAGDQGDRS